MAVKYTVEDIKFEIAFKTSWWLDPPAVSILVDENEKFNGEIKKDTIIKFSHTLRFTNHKLVIHRTGKTDAQVRINELGEHEGQDLIIDWIKIDGTNIRDLIWTKSVYKPDYPEPWASQERAKGNNLEECVLGETFLGHNGTWEFEFTSPFYRFIMNWMG